MELSVEEAEEVEMCGRSRDVQIVGFYPRNRVNFEFMGGSPHYMVLIFGILVYEHYI